MKRKEIKSDFDQMYEGMLMTFDEGQDIMFQCCECLMTHYIKIKIVGTDKGKRKLIFDMTKECHETQKARGDGNVEYAEGYEIKVTKIKNRRRY